MLFVLLASSLTFAIVTSVRAQEGRPTGSTGLSATLQVRFGTTPHWSSVDGTRVERLPDAERPGYDMFRYDGNYYAYNNDRWYMSPRESGEFQGIEERFVPSELSRVPREHWRNYPSGWRDRQYRESPGPSTSLQVTFSGRPRWMGIRGTRVQRISDRQRPDFDIFSYRGSYYVYRDGQWYMSRRPSGEFRMIDNRFVPRELSRVPREHWRNYPSGWQDRQSPGSYGPSATLQVDIGARPRWMVIRGTRVERLPDVERPGYDLFRYGGSYYAYNDGRWYTSRRGGGEFRMIEDRSVPVELSQIPREHWRNYPQGWQDGNRSPGYGSDGQRR